MGQAATQPPFCDRRSSNLLGSPGRANARNSSSLTHTRLAKFTSASRCGQPGVSPFTARFPSKRARRCYCILSRLPRASESATHLMTVGVQCGTAGALSYSPTKTFLPGSSHGQQAKALVYYKRREVPLNGLSPSLLLSHTRPLTKNRTPWSS